MGCQVKIADRSLLTNRLPAPQGNNPRRCRGCFRTAPADELVSKTTVEKDMADQDAHLQRLQVDWITSERNCQLRPVQPSRRFTPAPNMPIAQHHTRITVRAARCRTHRQGARALGRREQWLLDVESGRSVALSDRPRARTLTFVRRFALGLVLPIRGSVKTNIKLPAGAPISLEIINSSER
jgi:hypothetical protein